MNTTYIVWTEGEGVKIPITLWTLFVDGPLLAAKRRVPR